MKSNKHRVQVNLAFTQYKTLNLELSEDEMDNIDSIAKIELIKRYPELSSLDIEMTTCSEYDEETNKYVDIKFAE